RRELCILRGTWNTTSPAVYPGYMTHPMTKLLPSLLAVSLFAVSAHAQDSGRTLTVAGAPARVTTADSADTAEGGRSWFVSLLRKIARRSDDPEPADTAGAVTPEASEVVATEAALSAHSFKSHKDSLAWESARTVAEKSSGYRVVVDVFAKEMHVLDGNDTLRSAPVATAMNATLEYGGRVWRFETPRGVRTVRAKDKDPVWTPPEWHYAEVATEHHLKVAQLQRGHPVKLKDGTKLFVKGDEVGIVRPGSKEFLPMVLDEHIVFDNTLFIPPAGTQNSRIAGELGHFRLDLGDGYLMHGTPYAKSIGAAVTHGCVRLRDEDIEWLYENVPVGTKVYIY
ncbi:MAG: ErfK/YbiS/YcfS/YnhG family protein, partial [Gemmatimonadetes bacterium]|nr:ErfK/YbiS/YcfS/YnhG family protein [Gemmatimonadota bacterium]